MRLAELVLLSHVFILVGLTPPLFPFICQREREKNIQSRRINAPIYNTYLLRITHRPASHHTLYRVRNTTLVDVLL